MCWLFISFELFDDIFDKSCRLYIIHSIRVTELDILNIFYACHRTRHTITHSMRVIKLDMLNHCLRVIELDMLKHIIYVLQN